MPSQLPCSSECAQLGIRLTPRLGFLLLVELFVLYFFPKLNIFSIPWVTVTVKPEDVMWLIMLPILATQKLRLNNQIAISWFLIEIYLSISALWYPTNLILVARFALYALPIFYAIVPTEQQCRKIVALTSIFIYMMSIVAFLQLKTGFPYFHTGEVFFGPVDRASGIYGNGVEFALLALFASWLLHFLSGCSVGSWLATLVIAVCSGTRLVTVAVVLSGFVFGHRWSRSHIIGFASCWSGFLLAISILLPPLHLTTFDSASTAVDTTAAETPEVGTVYEQRLLEFELLNSISSVAVTISNSKPSTINPVEADGYCFNFDNALAQDKSLSMRLSKLRFVLENVVLGSSPLGFGLGHCIGNAGDNLFVRTLSDGGIPYLLLMVGFWIALFFARITNRTLLIEWRVYLFIIMFASFFYDTLYFSRVAPIFFITVCIVRFRTSALNLDRQPNKNCKIKSYVH